MWTFVIPAICVIAHLFLVIVFLPGFWREIDRRGFRWHNAFVLFVVPLGVSALIIFHVVGNFATLPIWLLVVAFLTVDALLIVMVLAAVGLRARRKRAA